MGVPNANDKHEDWRDSSLEDPKEESVGEKPAVRGTGGRADDDHRPEYAYDGAHNSGSKSLGQDGYGVGPYHVAKIESQGDPGIFQPVVELKVVPEAKDGRLAERCFVVVLDGVGKT